MKLLLTSGGVTNPSIHGALVDLLGKPVTECHALVVPTAQWGHPMCGPASVRGLVAADPGFRHFTGLGWASLGVLELTALPTIGAERWVPWVQGADVLLVDGGDATYLCHWLRESGLAELVPSLTKQVWVGVSAGSMVMTPRIGDYFVEWPSAPDDRHRRTGLCHRRADGHQGRGRLRRDRLGRPVDRVRRLSDELSRLRPSYV